MKSLSKRRKVEWPPEEEGDEDLVGSIAQVVKAVMDEAKTRRNVGDGHGTTEGGDPEGHEDVNGSTWVEPPQNARPRSARVARLNKHSLVGLDGLSVHGAVRRGLPGTRHRSGQAPVELAPIPGLESLAPPAKPPAEQPHYRKTPRYHLLDGTQGLPPPVEPAWLGGTMAQQTVPNAAHPKPKRGTGMYTKPNYQRAVTAYREIGINHSAVSRELGWGIETCRRLYKDGWRGIAWARPIADVIAEDTANGKAAAVAAQEVERREVQARAAVAKGKFEEAVQLEEHIISAARKNVAAAYNLSAQLLPAITAAVHFVREELCERVVDATGERWTPRTAAALRSAGVKPEYALKLIERYALIINRITATSDTVMDQSRLNRGQPTSITEERHSTVLQMTAEEAMLEIQAQDETIRLIAMQANTDKAARHDERRARMPARTKRQTVPIDTIDADGEEAPLELGEQVTYATPPPPLTPDTDDDFG